MNKTSLTITIKVDSEMVSNARDASKLVHMIALDMHQGHMGGFIRNQRTGDESNRWELNVAKDK